MKKSKYFIILFFVISFHLFAQNIGPFGFENYTPKWIHICRSDFIPNDFQALQVDNLTNGGAMIPLVVDGNMYVVMNVVKEYYDGYLVEKINLETGKEEWEDLYFTNERYKRRYAQTAEINNGLLDVIVFTENTKPDHDLWPAWFHGNLNKYGYDTETGIVQIKTNNTPGGLQSRYINMPETFIFTNSIVLRAYPFGDDFKYNIYQINNTRDGNTNVLMKGVHFAQNEILIDSTERRFNFPYLFKASRIRDLPDRKILFSINTVSEDNTQFDFSYLIMNRSLDILSQINLTSKLDFADVHSLVYCDSSSLVVGSVDQVSYQNTRVYMPDKLYLFNMDGELINKADMSGLYHPSQYHGMASTVIYDDNKPVMLTAVTYKIDSFLHYDFYKLESNGNLKLIRKLKLDDPDKYLGLNVMMRHKDDLICQFSYRDIPNSPPQSRTFVAYAAFPLDDILVISNEYSISNNRIELSPNPASDFVTIANFEDESAIYQITNSLGQVVQSQRLHHNRLYVGHLTPGLYFVKLVGKNTASTTLQFLKQ